MGVRQIARTVGINLFVLLVLLWSTNTCSSAVLDVQYVLEPYFAKSDPRAELPNYADPDRARELFREFDLLHTEYMPFFGWRRLPFEGRHTHVNAAGDRYQPDAPDAPDNAITVRFFGGSTMWGTGSTDDETIPAFFREIDPDLAVYNHGESGFVSRQNLARLISLANEAAPMDVVVFYDGYNDVRSLCRFDVPMQGHTRVDRIREALRPRHHLTRSLSDASVRVLRFLLPKGRKGEGPNGEPSRCHVEAERPARVIATLLNNWRIAREVARLAGAEFLGVLQPVAAMSTSRTERLVNDATFKGKAHELVYPDLRAAVAQADEKWMIDRSALFDRDEYIFIDAAHVSPNGNRMMARALHRDLAPALARARARKAAERGP